VEGADGNDGCCGRCWLVALNYTSNEAYGKRHSGPALARKCTDVGAAVL